jgi:hypothetical protein
MAAMFSSAGAHTAPTICGSIEPVFVKASRA